MDAVSHQIACRLINQAMAGNRVFAGKSVGNNGQAVMATLAGTGMASVKVRFVVDGEGYGIQALQSLAQQLNCFGSHAGSTFLNGLTVTFS